MKEEVFSRRFIIAVLGVGRVILGPLEGTGEVITDFTSGKPSGSPWRIVDDRVMGGRSRGQVALSQEKTMVFKGTLSLENNGGFSSVRSDREEHDFSRSQGLALRVRGDGRTYQLRLNTMARFRNWDVSFSASFKTEKDEWIDVRVPFSQFKAGFRGMSLANIAFDSSAVRRIGILLGDKRPGKFQLEVDSISTYGSASNE